MPDFEYVTTTLLGVTTIYALREPSRPRRQRSQAGLLCTDFCRRITAWHHEHDHRHESFCPDCRVLLMAPHYRNCASAAAQADRWTDEELAAAVEWP